MAEEIDESCFYREDFSTESDWEELNAQLCEIFQAWELSKDDWGRPLAKNELFQCEWLVRSEVLELRNKKITISYYAARLEEPDTEDSRQTADGVSQVHLDLMSLENTFGPPMTSSADLHPIARLYGLRRFVVIAPTKPATFLNNPSETCLFRSSINVTAAEVGSSVPVFVQIFDPKWNYFVGVHVAPSLRTNFDLVSLETAPAACRYLSGLLAMFKEKQPASYKRPAVVSVRNIYAAGFAKVRIPLWLPFVRLDEVVEETEHLSRIPLTSLPFGFLPDSCAEMFVVYSWPEIADNVAMDSELRTDFVPGATPCSSLHQVVRADAYLSSCLRDFVELDGATQSLESYVGRDFSGAASVAEVPNPLDQLTQPTMPVLRQNHKHNSGQRRRSWNEVLRVRRRKLPGPMTESELDEMLLYLLPEARPDSEPLYPYAEQRPEEFEPLRIKSASPDSLVSRLSCLLATCNAHCGGKSGVAQLWATFTRDLRNYVDSCTRIPGVAPGFPDTRTCLLHQKLQMLNVCMERRRIRESGVEPPVERVTREDDEDGDDVEEEEEFYDCAAYEREEEAASEEDAALKALEQPEGRLRRLGDLKLLHADEPLFVPVTQDAVPKTEDQLHEDAEVMLKLGPGSGLTTHMMCSSLLSDVEAFKAANPQAVMEDFIRWYSPKDWEEHEEGDGDGRPAGQLSARMLAPDNTWQTVWKQAKPVPVRRQKRLFDDTNEALKVLHFLETRNFGEIYELTLVPLLHSALLKLKDICDYFSATELFAAHIDDTLADLCRLSRDIEIVGQSEVSALISSPKPERVLARIKALELQYFQFRCFSSKFGAAVEKADIRAVFREALASGGSCPLLPRRSHDGGDDAPWAVAAGGGAVQLDLDFSDEMRDKLISKEYVMRVDGETHTLSRAEAGPQFLRAVLTGEKLTLCGAFSENTTFV